MFYVPSFTDSKEENKEKKKKKKKRENQRVPTETAQKLIFDIIA